MSFSLVQNTATVPYVTNAYNGAATEPLIPTLPSATTAGNLLILKLGGGKYMPYEGVPIFEKLLVQIGIDGFRLAESYFSDAGSGGFRVSTGIYYLDHIPSGITEVPICIGNALKGGTVAFLEEWSYTNDCVVCDQVGSERHTATDVSVTTFGNLSANNELAVSSIVQGCATATVETISPGAGYTQSGSYNNGLSRELHVGWNYRADTGSSQGSTETDDATTTTATVSVSVLATFKEVSAPAAYSHIFYSIPGVNGPSEIAPAAHGPADLGQDVMMTESYVGVGGSTSISGSWNDLSYAEGSDTGDWTTWETTP